MFPVELSNFIPLNCTEFHHPGVILIFHVLFIDVENVGSSITQYFPSIILGVLNLINLPAIPVLVSSIDSLPSLVSLIEIVPEDKMSSFVRYPEIVSFI